MVDELSKLEEEFGKYPSSIRFVRLVSLCLDKGRSQEAIALCEKGCETHKDYALGFYFLARCYFSVADFERALEASTRSCLLEPENPSGLIHVVPSWSSVIVTSSVLLRLIFMHCIQASISTSATGAIGPGTPALLSRMSTWPVI